MDLSLIIPCYNEQGNVEKFFTESENVFAESDISYEYIFVNDGSSDSTLERLRGLFNDNPDKNISVISFSRNFGKESAIYAGLNNCIGDTVCLIDADLQQRPETALKMYKILTSNPDCDCVCAYQSTRRENRAISSLKHCFYAVMNKIVETEIKDGASDFRLFNKKVKDAVLSMGEYHRFSKGIFSWVGFNVEFIEYEADERNDGKSKWSLSKLFKYAISGIIAFSTAPLKFAAYIGFISTAVSVIYAIITLIRKFTSDITVDGFTQLVILITFFSGVLLFTVGIIGEYIAKIYQQVKNRPIYIASEILKRNDK